MPSSFPVSASLTATFAPTGSEVAKFRESASTAAAVVATATGGRKLPRVAAQRFAMTAGPEERVVATGSSRLRTVLRSELSRFPMSYAETPDGSILIANGIDPVLVWDPRTRAAKVAGIAAPATKPTIAGVGTGTISGTYKAYVRYADDDGNVSNLSPISTSVTLAGVNIVRYTHTADATPPANATKRQFLRTTAGEATTWYVDVETADLRSSGPFDSLRGDTELSGQEAVPLLDSEGKPFANTHDVPMSHKCSLAAHHDRIFAAAEVGYGDGHVDVTSGSTTVTGIGTDWKTSFATRFLYVVGVTAGAEIASVNPANQTLTLAKPWAHATALFNSYSIRPAAAERRLVYYTPAGEPFSWPPTYALSLPDDGDEITALMVRSTYLFILKTRHIYRFTFGSDPATDGGLFLAVNRGCLNHRLYVVAEGNAYMLDNLGIHAYDGGNDPQPISDNIQSLFRSTDEDQALRLNWDADPLYWHATHSPTHNVVRFFVAMTGSDYPRHAIAYNYRMQRWWVEEYPFPVMGTALGRVHGELRAFCGTEHRTVIALDSHTVDGLPDFNYTHRGTPTAVYPLALADATANFATGANLYNLPIRIASGRGRGQWRRIVGSTATRISIDRPWTVSPGIDTDDDPSVYQIGGIHWEWVGGTYALTESEQGVARDVQLNFQPTKGAAGADIELWYNEDDDPRIWRYGTSGDGVRTVAGQSRIRVDLTHEEGDVHQRIDGHKDYYAHGDDYITPGLSGVKGKESVRIYRLTLAGASTEG